MEMQALPLVERLGAFYGSDFLARMLLLEHWFSTHRIRISHKSALDLLLYLHVRRSAAPHDVRGSWEDEDDIMIILSIITREDQGTTVIDNLYCTVFLKGVPESRWTSSLNLVVRQVVGLDPMPEAAA